MKIANYLSIGDRDYLQSTLYWIAGIFLFLYSAVLTLAPAVRYHSWAVNYRWEHWVGFAVWALSAIVINQVSQRKISNRDPYLLPVTALLIGVGLLTVFRLSVNFGWRQMAWVTLGALVLIGGMLKTNWIQKIRYYKYVWLLVGLLLTALTFVLGIYPSGEGPQLWLNLGGVFLQPSEPLKIVLIIYLSAYLADQWKNRHSIPTFTIPTIVIFISALLILIGQRDLGTASIFIIIYAFYMFLVSGKRRILILFALILMVAAFSGYQLFDVIKNRVDSWLNPWADPGGSSYQVIQSIQAMAAGGLLGSGPGIGSPGLVPVALSDFVFAAITEELGLAGALGIFCLYIFIAYRGIIISIKAANRYQQLLAAGITVLFTAQSFLILGGNTRLLPLTGVTLPFVSYGGSSLITSVFGMLLLLWVSQQSASRPASREDTKPYVFTFNTILLGFTVLSLVTGWWTIVQSDMLLSRTDNLRRIINDRFVKRGSILDRQNNPIAITIGEPGSYTRYINEPSLSSTVGYINPIFGLGGLEFSMDAYLRGTEGVSSSAITFANLLYSQPPQGLDLRTSIDLQIQAELVAALHNFNGAAVVMNAETGEILGLWTSPTFNANQLEVNWEAWRENDQSPLINRVTQGYYPVGNLLTPFLMAYTGNDGSQMSLEGAAANCSVPVPFAASGEFSFLLKNGCSKLLEESVAALTETQATGLLSAYKWTENASFELPQLEAIQPQTEMTKDVLVNDLHLSPLQIARAAAVFSQSGRMPNPRVAMAVYTPLQGWVIISVPESSEVVLPARTAAMTAAMSRMELPLWDIVASASDAENNISWFVSGTLPEWQSTPLVMVLVLEDSQPEIARINGRKLMGEFTTVVPEP